MRADLSTVFGLCEARMVQQAVARVLGVTADDLSGPDRAPVLVGARALVVKILKSRGWSYSAMGRALNRDHSSLMHLHGRWDVYLRTMPALHSAEQALAGLLGDQGHAVPPAPAAFNPALAIRQLLEARVLTQDEAAAALARLDEQARNAVLDRETRELANWLVKRKKMRRADAVAMARDHVAVMAHRAQVAA